MAPFQVESPAVSKMLAWEPKVIAAVPEPVKVLKVTVPIRLVPLKPEPPLLPARTNSFDDTVGP